MAQLSFAGGRSWNCCRNHASAQQRNLLNTGYRLEVRSDDESSYAGLSYRVEALPGNPVKNGKDN